MKRSLAGISTVTRLDVGAVAGGGASVVRGVSPAAVMPGLGPRIGIVQERLGKNATCRNIKQIANIPRMKPQVGHARRTDLAKQHGNAIHERLAADDPRLGVSRRHMDHMFAAPEADLEPERPPA